MPAQGLIERFSRRRRWGLLALLAAVLCASWVLARWQPRADPDPWVVRRMLACAETRLRADAPDVADELDRLTRRARGSAAEDRWDAPVAFAARQIREQRSRRESLRERWRAEELAVPAEIERARERLRDPGLGRREAGALQLAELGWSRAGKAAARGDWNAALEAVDGARAAVEEIEQTWQSIHRRFERRDLLRQWSLWAAETIAESRRTEGVALVVEKLPRRLTVYSAGRPVRSVTVELGADGLRRKLHAGDRATPEGRYRVIEIKTGGATRFYKALLLDYPNGEDRARYRRAVGEGRVPRGSGIGGWIEIHGRGGRGADWTDGCIALTDEEMDWLVPRVRVGTPVTLVGSFPSATADESGRIVR